jgi:phage repressor protein C with HTH and peptisase S24 domain
MRDAGYNPRSLSLAADLGVTAVRDILEERSASPRYVTLKALAKVLGVSVDYLVGGEAGAAHEAPLTAPSPAAVARNFPVFGAAEGGPSGAMSMSSDPIERIGAPDPLQTVHSGYGIYVVGESMSPAYNHGDIALVRPSMPRRGADAILIRYEPDGTQHALIKHLVDWTDTEWRVRQYNPPSDYALSRAEWREIQTVIGRYNAR